MLLKNNIPTSFRAALLCMLVLVILSGFVKKAPPAEASAGGFGLFGGQPCFSACWAK